MKYLVPTLKVDVIPNGAGDDFIQDVPIHRNQTILFQGNYAWLQNAEAARVLAKEVLPLIQKKLPNAKLLISGQNTSVVADLKSENIEISDLAVDDFEGVKKAFRESGVLVAPLYGPGGTRLKILSAMAARLPVVTTNVGIAEVGREDETFLQGETIEELAKQTVRILTDGALYKKIAESAWRLIVDEYTYQAIAKKLNKIYQEASNG